MVPAPTRMGRRLAGAPNPEGLLPRLLCLLLLLQAVIGSGVLYLPFFFAILGWVGGVIMTLLFGAITWWVAAPCSDFGFFLCASDSIGVVWCCCRSAGGRPRRQRPA